MVVNQTATLVASAGTEILEAFKFSGVLFEISYNTIIDQQLIQALTQIHTVQFQVMTIMLQLLVLVLVVAQAHCQRYDMEIATGPGKKHGFSGEFEALLIGQNGQVEFGLLEATKTLKANSKHLFQGPKSGNIGKIECVEITTKSDDMWLVDYIIVNRGPGKTYLYNTDQTMLSTDPSEGVEKMSLCRQGYMKYTLEVTTSTIRHADSDNIDLRVTLSGSEGDVFSGFVNNKDENNFESGETDIFILPDLKWIGRLECITMTVAARDKWLFETITVRYSGKSVTFTNADQVWLSANPSEGVDRLELCN